MEKEPRVLFINENLQSDNTTCGICLLLLVKILCETSLRNLLVSIESRPFLHLLFDNSVANDSRSEFCELLNVQRECLSRFTAKAPCTSLFLSQHESAVNSLLKDIDQLLLRFYEKFALLQSSVSFVKGQLSGCGGYSASDLSPNLKYSVLSLVSDLKSIALLQTRLFLFLYPLPEKLLGDVDGTLHDQVFDWSTGATKRRATRGGNSKRSNNICSLVYDTYLLLTTSNSDLAGDLDQCISSEFCRSTSSSSGWRRKKSENDTSEMAYRVWDCSWTLFDYFINSVPRELLPVSDIQSVSPPHTAFGYGIMWNVDSNSLTTKECMKRDIRELNNIEESLKELQLLQMTFAKEVDAARPQLSSCEDSTSRAQEDSVRSVRELLKARRNRRKYWIFEGGTYGSLSLGVLGAVIGGPIGAVVGLTVGAAVGATTGRALKEREKSQLQNIEESLLPPVPSSSLGTTSTNHVRVPSGHTNSLFLSSREPSERGGGPPRASSSSCVFSDSSLMVSSSSLPFRLHFPKYSGY